MCSATSGPTTPHHGHDSARARTNEGLDELGLLVHVEVVAGRQRVVERVVILLQVEVALGRHEGSQGAVGYLLVLAQLVDAVNALGDLRPVDVNDCQQPLQRMCLSGSTTMAARVSAPDAKMRARGQQADMAARRVAYPKLWALLLKQGQGARCAAPSHGARTCVENTPCPRSKSGPTPQKGTKHIDGHT